MSAYYPERRVYPQQRQQSTWGSLLWPVVVLLALVALLVWWFRPYLGLVHDPNAAPRAVTPRGDLAEAEKATIDVFKSAAPCVVHITTVAFMRDFLSDDVQEIPQGTGSGFVWDEEGHVVTNFH